MLAENISDVIFSTDAELNASYVSPSVQHVFGYSPEWALLNGLHQTATNPRQLGRLNGLLRRVRHAIGDRQKLAELRKTLASICSPSTACAPTDARFPSNCGSS